PCQAAAVGRGRAVARVELVPLVELEGDRLVDDVLRGRGPGQGRPRDQHEHRQKREPHSTSSFGGDPSTGRPPRPSPAAWPPRPGWYHPVPCPAPREPDLTTFASGTAFGPYQILEPLGRGGMATVYKAYEPGLDRYVALKILPREFLHDEGFAERFRREAKVIARLEHPNIIPIHNFGIQEQSRT